jgi:bacteriorhodopsin
MFLMYFILLDLFLIYLFSLYFFFLIGLLRLPKWGHIKICEPALVVKDPTVTSKMSNNSCARPRTKVGIKTQPPWQ